MDAYRGRRLLCSCCCKHHLLPCITMGMQCWNKPTIQWFNGKTMSASSACTLVNISSYTTSTLIFACHREKRQFVPPMSAVRRTSFCSCAKQLPCLGLTMARPLIDCLRLAYMLPLLYASLQLHQRLHWSRQRWSEESWRPLARFPYRGCSFCDATIPHLVVLV